MVLRTLVATREPASRRPSLRARGLAGGPDMRHIGTEGGLDARVADYRAAAAGEDPETARERNDALSRCGQRYA